MTVEIQRRGPANGLGWGGVAQQGTSLSVVAPHDSAGRLLSSPQHPGPDRDCDCDICVTKPTHPRPSASRRALLRLEHSGFGNRIERRAACPRGAECIANCKNGWAQIRFFFCEAVDVRFGNGVERRVPGGSRCGHKQAIGLSIGRVRRWEGAVDRRTLSAGNLDGFRAGNVLMQMRMQIDGWTAEGSSNIETQISTQKGGGGAQELKIASQAVGHRCIDRWVGSAGKSNSTHQTVIHIRHFRPFSGVGQALIRTIDGYTESARGFRNPKPTRIRDECWWRRGRTELDAEASNQRSTPRDENDDLVLEHTYHRQTEEHAAERDPTSL
ncbi:hypothetical protein B0H10DRAFT_2196570 [Mycena sp. CBHHK59/15]|nr:hypothetical protein B0H10DRAFT_2196570 [Mycena sp. CBHHK59/15]